MENKRSILFLSHGGGPLPLLGDESHTEMVSCLREIGSSLGSPSAILVISAHWEEETAVLTSGKQPPLIYDYYGFPEESYNIEYPCKGKPNLADKIHKALTDADIDTGLHEKRGFDHGLFVPLKIMYPKANIPCVQLSLVNNLDPMVHINIGKTLRSLEYENLLVVGSGFSFHNMNEFFSPETSEAKSRNESFEKWLLDTCSDQSIEESERTKRLAQWAKAPFARYCHPREEHLLPLHVCYGLAGTYCSELFELKILNKKASMYLWQ